MTTIEGSVAPGWGGVREAFETNFESGSEIGAAFSAYHKGSKVVDLWGGVADAQTGRQWQEDTLVLVYSTTKGLTAMCANRLADSGALDVEAPVREYWPEFAKSGKDQITVSDLLSHRAGLAWIDGTMTSEEMLEWDLVIEALEDQAPVWIPRSAHGYHATTYGWLVGEVVRRVSGRSVGTYLREEIAGPLEADCFIGLPVSEEHRVARLVPFNPDEVLQFAQTTGGGLRARPRAPEAVLLSGASTAPGASGTAGGREPGSKRGFVALAEEFLGPDSPLLKALTAPGGSFGDESLWSSQRLHAAEIPAANGICDARSIARLYSACANGVATSRGEEFRVFSPQQLDRALRQETEGPDSVLLGLDIQWGLGFMLNRGIVAESKMGGPRSFGHFGMGGSLGWADPDSQLAVGYVMNKMSMGTTGDPRGYRLVRACVDAAQAA